MLTEAKFRTEGIFVKVDWGTVIDGKMDLTPAQAFAMADALRACAYKAERNMQGLLPSKHDVDAVEQAICGHPAVILSQPHLSRMIRKEG